MRLKLCVSMLAGTLLTIVLPALGQQSDWHVTKTLHIGGEGGWDYVTADLQTNRLFVTRSTHTQVINTSTGNVIADIPGQLRSHGTAIVPSDNRGFGASQLRMVPAAQFGKS